jgi:hypothetical protein
MGWRDRDYAQWTDEERRRFYGSGATSAGSRPDVFGGHEGSRRGTGGRVFRRGVGPAIFVSGVLLALGRFPTSHPILPSLHFRLPGVGDTATPASIRPTGTINTPGTATLGSTLTFHGTAPPGNGPVTVEGSYDGGQTWQTLSTVDSVGGSYTAQITLNQRGFLQLRIVFADGSRAVGSVTVS